MTAEADQFVLPTEAAEALRISERTVRRLCAKGDLAVKVGGRWRIYASRLARITSPPADGDAA